MDVIKINMKFERFFWKYKYGPKKVDLNTNEGTFIGTIVDTDKGEVFVPAHKMNKAENK